MRWSTAALLAIMGIAGAAFSIWVQLFYVKRMDLYYPYVGITLLCLGGGTFALARWTVSRPVLVKTLCGCALGHGSALAAGVLAGLLSGADGWQRLLNTLSHSPFALLAGLPFLQGGWLVGGLLGLAVALLWKPQPNGTPSIVTRCMMRRWPG